MSENRRRPSIILDAGYVSIKANDRYKASKIIGLQRRRFVCVIITVLILFFISCLNLTCLIWIMYQLDWSPFYQNGSKIFRFDRINRQVELYHQARFKDTIFTTNVEDLTPVNISSDRQMDIYGDHNSILFDEDQIAMNAEYFYINNRGPVEFNNLYLFQFEQGRRTRIHLDRINAQHIHSKYMNLFTENNITISDVNQVLFSGQGLTVTSNRNSRQSTIRFGNHPRRKYSSDRRQKMSFGNIDFRVNSIFLDLPRPNPVADTHDDASNIYRICICNTTFLLLRSFSHQPCPLC